MVIKIKKKVLILLILAFTLVSCCGFLISGSIAASRYAPPKITVVIDAGHGGIDGGAVGVESKTSESELNLAVSYELKSYFQSAGVTVVMTREDENGLYGTATDGYKRRDMLERKRIIEKTAPNLVISVHMNRFGNSSRRGAQVYFQKGADTAKTLACIVQNGLNEYINIPQTGKCFSALAGDYYILNSHQYTAIIVECGFLSNVQDDRLLNSKEYREKTAYIIYGGIMEYLAIFCDVKL